MIIGLAGLPGCGKDTAARILMQHGGYQPMGFSDSLKYTVAELFDYPYEMLQAITEEQREVRSTIDPRYGKTPVKILEEVGLKMREVYPMIFVDRTLNFLGPDVSVVITDMRYPNEAEAIKKKGGQIWKIERGDSPQWVKNVRREGIQSYSNMSPKCDFFWCEDAQDYIHEAQWRMQCEDMEEEFDVVIRNDTTLQDFEQIVQGLAAIEN